MLPISVPENFRIIAHRGASAYAPENSAEAFKLAFKMGINEFEMDTQLSNDGIVVLCHDKTLERYGHDSKIVEECCSSELLALEMGLWFSPFLFSGSKMLTLNELFLTYGNKITYHIELKGEAKKLSEEVLNLINKFNLMNSCIVTSFSFESLKTMRSLTNKIRLGWLVDYIDLQVCEKAKQLNMFQLCPKAEHVNFDMVKLGQKVVPEIRAWGITGKSQEVIKQIQQVLNSGCDGVTINWPDWIVQEG